MDVKLYNADCLNIMKTMPDKSVDLVLTDPPYNIGQENKRTKVGNTIMTNKQAWGEWDDMDNKKYDEFIFGLMKNVYRILKDGGSFYCFTAREKNGYFSNYAEHEIGFTYQNTIAILKTNPLPHFSKTNWRSAFELAFYVSKGKPKTFNFLTQQEMVNTMPYLIGQNDTEHPTEKPVYAMKRILQVNSNPEDLIFDPFMGSGTSGVACKELNRNFIGIELNKKYFDIAKRRIECTTESLF